MNTSTISRELANTGKTHKPMARMLMTYSYDGKNHAQLLNMTKIEGREMAMRTLSWAANNKVEIIFRPV
jgi:hypothetical protein